MSSFFNESHHSLIDLDVLAELPEEYQSRVNDFAQLRARLKVYEEKDSFFAKLRLFNFTDMYNYIFNGPGIVLFIILDVCVDIPFILLYIVEMEVASINPSLTPIGLFIDRPIWIYDLCLIFSFCNIISFIGRTLSATDTFYSLISFHSLVDLLTCVPFLISLGLENGSLLYIPYFLRSVIVIKRIRRLMYIKLEFRRTSKFTLASIPNTGVSERIVVLVSAILVILYVSLGAFEYIEAITHPELYRMKFIPSLYLHIVTGSTVGYGDITPSSNPGRIIIILFILATISVIPSLIGRLIDTIRRNRQGGGAFEDKNARFVVIFGRLSNFRTIVDILDFFQSDIELESVKIVLIGSGKVNDDVSALITLPTFANHVFYLKGSALSETDLIRAKVQFADAVFVLCDRELDAEQEDEMNCLRVWSLKQFAPNTRVFSIVKTQQAEHFQRAADVVVCIEVIKTVLLAYSSLNPGASTFITNLMNSFVPRSKIKSKWVMEYNDGCCNEMYTCSIPVHLKGFNFYNIAPFLYQHYQVLLIGVRIWSSKYQRFNIFLNPYDYRPTLEDEFIVLAQDPKDVDAVEQMDLEFFCKMYTEPSIVIKHEEMSSFNEFPFIGNYVHDVPYRPFTTSKRPVCHLLKDPLPLKDRVLENADKLQNHILIIPKDHQLGVFLIVMRSAILQKSEFFDIVVLCKRLPTAEEYKLLERFPRIFFIKGNPRKMRDLELAGALTCSRVVIFSQLDSGNQVKDFDDAPSLMIKHSISILWQEHGVEPKIVLVELTERRNVRFLSSDALRLAPIYKKKIKRKKVSDKSYTTIEEVVHDPVFAAGQVMIDNLLDNIIFHSYKGSHAFDLVRSLCGIRLQEDLEMSREMGISDGYMFTEPVPMEYWEVTFSDFFRESLIQHRRIAVALYRQPSQERGNELPYLYTAPVPIVKLRKGDSVFYIGNR